MGATKFAFQPGFEFSRLYIENLILNSGVGKAGDIKGQAFSNFFPAIVPIPEIIDRSSLNWRSPNTSVKFSQRFSRAR